MIDFKNKKILITGATGGIGGALVKKFISLVLPGVFEVLAIDFLPVKKLINEDFPTFDLPEKHISIKSPSDIS